MADDYVPLDTRAKLTVTALAATAVFDAAGFLDAVGVPGMRWAQVIPGTYTSPTVLLGMLTMIAFLAWLSQARSNLVALGSPAEGYSAIAPWFIPIVNLWLPYTVVREVWARSGPEAERPGGHAGGAPWFMKAWWTAWVASQLTPFILTFVGIVGIVDLVRVVAAVLAIKTVLALTARQSTARGAGPVAF